LSEQALERFVRKIHRRLVLIRAVEHLGVCVSVGCGIALPLLAILLLRGQSVVSLLLVIGSFCSLAACVLTIQRWPTLLQAAGEADRQLNLDDLLTTAVRLDRYSCDSMSGSVLAMADARCGRISPSTVILNRYGARAWGGIVLSLAAVIAVSLMPAHPIRSAVAQENRSILTGAGQAVEESAISKRGENTGAQALGENSNRTVNQTDLGTGGDFAATNHRLSVSSEADSNLGEATESSFGSVSGGGKSKANDGAAGVVGGLGTSTGGRNIEPWQSSGREIQPGSVDPAGLNVPAQDRDLVRQYFDGN
jgi:hypothetical protein